MSLRDKAIAANRDIASVFDGFFYGIANGIEWLEPFLPWMAFAGVFTAVVWICFG